MSKILKEKENYKSKFKLDDTLLISEKYYQNFVKKNLIRLKTKSFFKSLDDVSLDADEHMIQNMPMKILERQRMSLFLSMDSIQDLEEFLSLQDLKTLRSLFMNAVKVKQETIYGLELYQSNKKIKELAESLTKEEFLNAFASIPYFSYFESDFSRLFDRMDAKHAGHINLTDFFNYFQLRYKEKEFLSSLRSKPFNNQMKIKHALHNQRETTVKFLFMENPWRFLNITRRGAIGLWSKTFQFLKSYQIFDQTNANYSLQYFNIQNQYANKVKSSVWINDAILIPNRNMVCVATSRRDLRFFIISSENFYEDFYIHSFKQVITCLDYCYDDETKTSYLLAGDTAGNINIIQFLKPDLSFYDENHKLKEKILDIKFSDIGKHDDHMRHKFLELVHNDYVRSVKFNKFNKTIISSSSDMKKPLIIMDPEGKKKTYIFELGKACTCFDFCEEMHIVCTSSTKSPISIYDIYNPSRPIASLQEGYDCYSVIGLKIHYPVGYLYSLSMNALKVWDIKEEKCLQSVDINFPSTVNLNMREYGPFPLTYYSNKSEAALLLSYNDFIGYMAIGENVKLNNQIPTTHVCPISCMVYSPVFKIVITCTTDSSITFWNLVSGKKIISLRNSHDNEEVTFATLDQSQKRLYTGGRNGTIKTWNVANGQLIQLFEPIDDSEITGLIVNQRKKLMISVGWSKKIVTYTDISFDDIIIPVKPKLLYKGVTQHKDDILCLDTCKDFLATGSYDGEINVWIMETQLLFVCLTKGKTTPNQPIDKLLFLNKYQSNLDLSSIVLVSSEAGYLRFWNLNVHLFNHLYGSFYSSAFEEQSTLALTTDPDNNYLVTGDTKGFSYVWDIKDTLESLKSKFQPPKLLYAWRSHDSAIVSCEFIANSDGAFSNDLICTASTDFCCRLWTLAGAYIGVFGQEAKWNLRLPRTFHSIIEAQADEDGAKPGKKSKIKIVFQDEEGKEMPRDKTDSSDNMPTFSQNDISENVFGWSYSELNDKFDYLNSLKFFDVIKAYKRNSIAEMMSREDKKVSKSHDSRNKQSTIPYDEFPIYNKDMILKENYTVVSGETKLPLILKK